MNFRLTGIKDTDLLILEKLDDRSLFSYCQTNQYANNVCQDENFWRNRLITKYGIETAELKNIDRSWKDFYLKLVYFDETYTPEKASLEAAKKGYDDLFFYFSKFINEYNKTRTIVRSLNKHLLKYGNFSKIIDILAAEGFVLAVGYNKQDLINFYLPIIEKEGFNVPFLSNIALLRNGKISNLELEKFKPEEGLKEAVYSNNKKLIEYFINKLPEIKYKRTINEALKVASEKNHKEIIEYLISKGADDWNLGLRGAVYSGDKNLVDYFLSKGAKITLDIITYAKEGGYKEIINYLNEIK